jgi:carbamoyltransferase
MLILGLSTFGQNPAACIVRDGHLVGFAEEERFVRIKGAAGRFPGRALGYCLREAGAQLAEVGAIAVGWDADKYRWRMPWFFARTWWQRGRHAAGGSYGTIWKELIDQHPASIRKRIQLGLRTAGLSGPLPPIEFVAHHLAHAASAYYASGWDRSAVLVVDGSGEERATSFFEGEATTLRERGHVDLPDSLGWFYAAITAYLGFVPYEEEGFTMGLAAYGRRDAELEDKLARVLGSWSGGGYRVDPSYTLLGQHSLHEHFADRLVELLGPPRSPGQALTDRHRNLAWAAQTRLESVALELVRQATDGGRLRRLCLAGGVALNCKMNGVLARSPYVDEIFVQPASHDGGSALGAALWLAREHGEDPRFRMEHAQWGPGYSAAEVERALEIARVPFRREPAVDERAAELIAAGKVVAWFQGRMEVGPRALGGRSILADATRPDMKDRINARVKFRDDWRPFCPSLTAQAAGDLLADRGEGRFMTVAHDVPAARRAHIPAVIHVDGTTRPQIVSPAAQPRYHRLLQLVEQRVGRAIVLNTSLNVKGEPLACTPTDALRCLYSSGLDALAIEDFWIEKP